jgi:hypothetical protein
LQKRKVKMPLFLRNSGLELMMYSGWKERQALPSNSTLAHLKKEDKERLRYGREIVKGLVAGCHSFCKFFIFL